MEPTLHAVAAAWNDMRDVIAGALPDIAARFSRLLKDITAHDALVIFTHECTGRPRKVSGSRDVIDRVTIAELEELRQSICPGQHVTDVRRIAGTDRRIWARRDVSDTLLVLVLRQSDVIEPDTAERVAAMFGLVATSIQQQVSQASPDYLAESRAASSERARTTAQLTEMHEATLSSILSTLRSHHLDDRRARLIALESASDALIAARSASAADRDLSEEAVSTAFARLRTELDTLVHPGEFDVEFVEPPVDGRPLPGEIAYGARALVRTIVLAFNARPGLTRLRIAWDCDGENVSIEVRDQSSGNVDHSALRRQLAGRLHTLGGHAEIETIPGWGNRVVATIPLDPPAGNPDERMLSTLNPREYEVLGHLAAGRRNKAIAADLGISESTVKFHVASLLRKLELTNRAEAGAVGIRAGIIPRGSAQR
ncbi:DNA-binding CsgD family transcriptional regulator [Mycolicibacterium sp. 624]